LALNINFMDYPPSGWRVCVAPMIDVTDRHCRHFHRLLAPQARLYTEMVATGALLHGDAARHLDYDASQHPLALQLGGSEPAELAHCAKLAQQWGYDEVNLNCGCPSDKVQKGAFGACLMREPRLVADAWRAMRDAVDIPVTIKHRLGLGHEVVYGFARDFVGALFDAGCRVFIVHARNAVLEGLSPKDNREIPPLRHDLALQLKRDCPEALFVLNGGIASADQALSALESFDGVMLGRAAWHHPQVLAQLSAQLAPHEAARPAQEIMQAMVDYARAEAARGTPMRMITRAMLGWMGGRPGARLWRRTLSDARLLAANDARVIEQAWEKLQLP
jgi:tRNA-dihydrouridine synthase A